MDIGIGYVPAIVVVFAVIWILRGLFLMAVKANEEISKKLNS